MTEKKQKLRSLLDKKLVASFISIDKDGYPHSIPIWIVEHNSKLYFSTSNKSQKYRNLIKNKNVAVSIVDPSGYPYSSASGIGKVVTKENSEYSSIIKKIVEKYVPPENRQKFISERLEAPDRVIIETDIVKII